MNKIHEEGFVKLIHHEATETGGLVLINFDITSHTRLIEGIIMFILISIVFSTKTF